MFFTGVKTLNCLPFNEGPIGKSNWPNGFQQGLAWRFMGVLDFTSFLDLPNNSFGQFLNNYANDKLHLHLIREVVEFGQEEHDHEDIKRFPTDDFDGT